MHGVFSSVRNTRLRFLIAWLGFCGVASVQAQMPPDPGPAWLPPGEAPPNILLIMADDLGWKDLACYGNRWVETPALDRLARQGIRFTDAYAAAPVCTPTRAALMTGLAPARLQITNHAPGHPPGFARPGSSLGSAAWTRHLALDQITLAEQLAAAGYATGFFGKWHLSYRPPHGEPPQEADLRPRHQGFDVNFGGCDFGGPPSYFSPYRNPALGDGQAGEYLPDRLADECVRFLKENRSRPWFVCLWNYSVHYPFQAPPQLIEKYRRRQQETTEDIGNPVYLAMIEGMDRAIGRLLCGLQESGQAADTLVLFTSDNGPFAADVRPLRGEKGYLYEGGIRVPLLIRQPGRVPPGNTCATPVITMDLHATILAATGVDPAGAADGVDLGPLLDGGGSIDRESLFFHYPNHAFHKQNRLASAIRHGPHKLIWFPEDGSVELYQLEQDIGEQHNLAAQQPERVRYLKKRLDEWLVETGANLPVPVSSSR